MQIQYHRFPISWRLLYDTGLLPLFCVNSIWDSRLGILETASITGKRKRQQKNNKNTKKQQYRIAALQNPSRGFVGIFFLYNLFIRRSIGKQILDMLDNLFCCRMLNDEMKWLLWAGLIILWGTCHLCFLIWRFFFVLYMFSWPFFLLSAYLYSPWKCLSQDLLLLIFENYMVCICCQSLICSGLLCSIEELKCPLYITFLWHKFAY